MSWLENWLMQMIPWRPKTLYCRREPMPFYRSSSRGVTFKSSCILSLLGKKKNAHFVFFLSKFFCSWDSALYAPGKRTPCAQDKRPVFCEDQVSVSLSVATFLFIKVWCFLYVSTYIFSEIWYSKIRFWYFPASIYIYIYFIFTSFQAPG